MPPPLTIANIKKTKCITAAKLAKCVLYSLFSLLSYFDQKILPWTCWYLCTQACEFPVNFTAVASVSAFRCQATSRSTHASSIGQKGRCPFTHMNAQTCILEHAWTCMVQLLGTFMYRHASLGTKLMYLKAPYWTSVPSCRRMPGFGPA